jgi:transposase
MSATVYVGIDPAAESFTASYLLKPGSYKTAPKPFANSEAGLDDLEAWLRSEEIDLQRVHFCVENTGVYSELIAYQLHQRASELSLLDPRTVWKAFGDGQPKNDPLDSRRIAEYGFRYADQLRLWQPQEVIVEQIRVILSTREQLVQQKTATQNARSTLARKIIQTPAANEALETTLSHLKAQIVALTEELKRLIRSHPTLMQGVSILMSAPGVSWLLSAHLLVITRGFTEIPSYRTLAQYLGISPNEHSSGTSVRKRERSRRYGPSTARKLLHLAARSLRTHHPSFQRYFLEKTAAGKPKPLVLNNIANKLLKQLCAMMQSGTPYNPAHRSLNPRLLALA